MRITCIGGGPAGLYFAVLAKLADPAHRITVLERNPAGVTYGWGVVFWDDLLDDLFAHDPVSAGRIWDAACRWDEYEVRATGKDVKHLAGYGFSLGRHRLLEILSARALELGVEIRYHASADDAEPADLVVVCEGAGSVTREGGADHFGTEIDTGRNKYIWLGTPHVFRTFTFGFERTEHGWIWFHAYPFDDTRSTFIVECTPETWAGLGLDRADAPATLERIFAAHLDGRPLIDQHGARWLTFRRVTNQRWDNGSVVLMGDAAHTTHFAIGSGTKLAMQDAMALAGAVSTGEDLTVALERYENDRKAAIAPLQRAALASSTWFERIDEYGDLDATEFSYALSNRRGDYPAWRYLLHRGTQNGLTRTLLRWTLSARRWNRARRRPAAPPSSSPTAGHPTRPASKLRDEPASL